MPLGPAPFRLPPDPVPLLLRPHIDRVLDAAGVDRGTFDTDLRRSLHDLLEQTTNFRAFQYVVEMLLAHHHWKVGVHRPADLRQLLEHDLGARRLPLPAVRSQRGQRLMFRRKDKSELLADAMLRHFPTPQAVADAAATEIGDFDPAAFLAEADHSFIDAVLSLCLIYSPRDLVLLLGQDEIQQEIDALHLDPAQLFADRGSKAHLLVRGLGFTLMEKPKGLADFAEAVRAAQDLVDDDTARTNVVSAAGLTVLQHVRSALLDVLHFWATSLFGSVRELVRTVNAVSPHQQAIDSRQLEIPQLVQLLRYLLDTSVDATSIYRLAFPGDGTPVSDALLSACDAFVLAAEQFRSTPRSLKVDGPSDDFRARCAKLAAAAADVLEAGKSSFPAVIKLSEIVFDEYGRKIFRGVDSDNHEVRFTLAGDEERDELLVARHYYMLPKKPVSVNPHIVPRGGQAVQVLFDRAEAYDAASLTQRLQADRLLGLMHLSADDNVLDVGTGTGTLAVEIGSRVRRVHGIDKSPAMVRRAEEHARAARSTNVTFEVADLLRYDVPSGYDVVLSNATMHWILPPDAAYAQLFRLIRPGGRIGVHQGGHGNYEGLHRFTRGLLTDMNLGQFFQGFLYPVYYPSAEAFRDLLEGVGFVDVEVTAVVTDGSELPDLLRNFAEAGLLPYLRQLPEVDEESFRAEWLEEAQDGVTDRYTHRLYATAQRP